MKPAALIYLLWEKNLSVLDQFLSRKHGTVITLRELCSPQLQAIVNRHQSNLVALQDMLAPEDKTRLTEEANRRLVAVETHLQRNSVWANLGQTPSVGAETHNPLILDTLHQDLLSSLFIVEALDKVLERFTVELAVVNEDYMQLARTTVLWARRRNIPSLHLAHGLALAQPYTIHAHADADITAVFGKRGMEGFLDIGIPPERLRITGNPAWDKFLTLQAERSALKTQLYAGYRWNPETPLVVFATTWVAGLTVIEEKSVPEDMVRAVFRAYREITTANGPSFFLVIKDRIGVHTQIGHDRLLSIAASEGLGAGDFCYETVNTEALLASADVVIACDSNICVEAMHLGIPSINLTNLNGLRMGPSFDGESGITDIEPQYLVITLPMLLSDREFRQRLQKQLRARVPYYNLGFDGSASSRVASLMMEMIRSPATESDQPEPGKSAWEPKGYVWESLDRDNSAVDDIHADYHHHVRAELIELFKHAPKRVLDVGCAAGVTGEAIKRLYPHSQVVGIEPNRRSQLLARERIDEVIEGSIEHIDLHEHGITPHSIDTVILADVLEHMYNPWGVLVKLRPYLTADAQVLASIPNSRNLAMVAQLAAGHWTYEKEGLLDVTHIRFFTLNEIRKLFEQTGYAIEQVGATFSPHLQGINPGSSIRMGSIEFKDLSEQDLYELRAFQFLIRALPATSAQSGRATPGNDTTSPLQVISSNLIEGNEEKTDYALLLERQYPGEATLTVRRSDLEVAGQTPSFCLFLPLEGDDRSLLAETLDSLSTQIYPEWRLVVVSHQPCPDPLFEKLPRLIWRSFDHSVTSPDAALDMAIEEYPCDWLGFLKPGDRLEPQALLSWAKHIVANPEWRLIYTDEDRIDGEGLCHRPQFKPDFNLDLLRSSAYPGSRLAVRRDAFLQTGGLGLGGPFELTLKVLDHAGQTAIGHIDEVLCHVHREGESESEEACKQALIDHLARNQADALVADGYQPGTFRIEYKHPQQPLVSIIIPTKDQLELLKACVDSILNLTDYPYYEIIIVDNNSKKPETLEYLDELVDMEGDTVRVIQYTGPFNYSAENNAAAKFARGDYLLLLNNDTQILEEDWLDKMMGYAQRPDIGIVGVRLLYPGTGKLQHAGIIMGLGGIAEHPYLGLVDASEPGYMNRLHVDQNVSAVTGACLLIRKSIYEQAGGLDEVNFKVCYNDVDLCLKVGQLGYKVLWTPHVTLLHHGSVSQKEAVRHMDKTTDKARFASEKQAMLEKWLPVIARDPFYNRHLSLTQRDFRVEHQCVINWDPRLPSYRTRVLGWTLPGASCEYRIKLPLQALRTAGTAEDSYVWPPSKGSLRKLLPAEIARAKPDVLTVTICSELLHHVETLQQIRQLCKIPIILQMDDLLTEMPKGSETHTRNDAAESLKKLLALADRVVVTTPPIAELCKGLTEHIHLIPNYLPKSPWEGLSSRRRQGTKPRVGWAGAMQHGSNLAMIVEVIKATAAEADWIFFGMYPEALRPLAREIHPFVPFEDYPAKLTSLNLDLAIAPLENNPFNEAKSNLCLLEYGRMGWPVICSDILPYRDAPVARVQNRPLDWIDAIRERLHDLDAAEREGDRLQEWVRGHWMLEDNLEEWAKIYRFAM